jgi:hypothetical protein
MVPMLKHSEIAGAIAIYRQTSGLQTCRDRDPVSQKMVRDALLVLATTITDTSKAFGTKDQVDPVQRLIGAASAS